MLFNSHAFIFGFLPVALAGFFALARLKPVLGAIWLALASTLFYAVWDPRYLFLLLGSAAFNFAAGLGLTRLARDGRATPLTLLLSAALAANLLVLGFFKYSAFFVENLNALSGAGLTIPAIVLPLGISFFTFTQIAYLVDTARGRAEEPSPVRYLLFVTWFPHLIAGPILHHAEMMPQFRLPDIYRFNTARFATGLAIFTIGLFKKSVLADGISVYVGPVFDAADAGAAPMLFDAWSGTLAYTLQLYFDFSGYSDMAIGLSWLFGIGLPLNFNSPYKSTSIVDFWRRWHMTLSRFLRDYLYFPLGGNRKGKTRRYANLLATMVIGGLWHGAGWTFVAWGTLHGLYLIVNHAWTARGWRMGKRTGWAFTFLAVAVAWVFFRAHSMGGALRILGGMGGLNGIDPPASIAVWIWCAVLGFIVLGLPNTQEIARDGLAGISRPPEDGIAPSAVAVRFRRSILWAGLTAAMLAVCLIDLATPTSFLYFNF